jgi:NAD(P)-dependent dehydrogenase (short-subunit alcohol dehydrogenase family)
VKRNSTFVGCVAIVTGGASGIGASISRELYRQGAHVVVADHDEASAKLLCAKLQEGPGGSATDKTVDVRDSEAMSALVADTLKLYGQVDLFFNNAGILSVGEIRDLQIASWRRIIETNLFGVINGTQAAYTAMLGQGFGHIVNVASLAGLINSPLYAPYAASKAAVIALSTALRLEAAPLGIRVSIVCPGNVNTHIFGSSEVVNARRADVFKTSRLAKMDPDAAASIVLAGVARNAQFIVFPAYSRILWWLQRLAPWLLDHLSREVVRRFRTSRITQ